MALAIATCWPASAHAAPADVTIEGESMTYPGPGDGNPVSEPGTSSGQALWMKSSSWAKKTVTTTRQTDYLFVKAKGQACGTDQPLVAVKIDGVDRFSEAFGNGAYRDAGIRIALPAGTHEVWARFANDYFLEVGGRWVCDRNAYLDRLTLVASPFSASGWRNQPLPASTTPAGNSAQMVAELQQQIASNPTATPPGPGVWVTTGDWAVPVYTVGPDQPLVNVASEKPNASLTAQWTGVPLPEDAKPSEPPWNPALGKYGDANLVVWQPSTDTLWEFFHLRRNDPVNPTGWTAYYGGRMQNVSQHEGQFEDPPGQLFGSAATSLAHLATMPRLEEVKRGVIDHAIGFTIKGASGYDGWCWPAHRTDPQHSRRDTAAIPAGTRFRFAAAFDVAQWEQNPADPAHPRPLTPFARMMVEAIRKYGMVLSDSGGGVGFGVESWVPTGSDPFYANGQPRADGPFGGRWPDQGGVFENFPWSELEALAQPSGAAFGCHDDPDTP
jgi:hypothetical protein